METAKQVILITDDSWLSENEGLWSWQEFSKDIQDRIERYNMYQKRFVTTLSLSLGCN